MVLVKQYKEVRDHCSNPAGAWTKEVAVEGKREWIGEKYRLEMMKKQPEDHDLS